MEATELFTELFFGDTSGFLGIFILVVLVVFASSKNKWVDLLGFVAFIVLGLEYYTNADPTKAIYWGFALCWLIAVGCVFDLIRRNRD